MNYTCTFLPRYTSWCSRSYPFAGLVRLCLMVLLLALCRPTANAQTCTFPAASIPVTGFGYFLGPFQRDGDFNGAPQWSYYESDFYGTTAYLQWSGTRWEFTVPDYGTILAYATTGSSTKLPCTDWELGDAGLDGVPTLLAGCANNPKVSIAASPANVTTAGTSVTFTATPTLGGTTPDYQWKKNNLNVGINTATYIDAAPANGDVVKVVMTSNQDASCILSTTAVSNTLSVPTCGPTVTIATNPSLTITYGQTATLTASGATSYTWSTGETTAAISVSAAGTYSVVGSTSGCSSRVSATLTVNPISLTLVPAADPTTCVGLATNLSVSSSGGTAPYSYSWVAPDGMTLSATATSSISATATSAGVKTFTIIVTGAGGASVAIGTATVNVTVMTPPSVTIAATPGTLITAGTSVTFTATSIAGGLNPGFQWQKNGINVGTNSTIYIDNTLTNNDLIQVVMASSLEATCGISTTVTSNPLVILYDPPSMTWVSRNSAADNKWQSVTYGNGLFVAVATSGSGNRVMTSPDGITWTSRTSAADNNWLSVTYGNGMFVAVANSGSGNRVMTSPDGIMWTSRAATADILWNSVTYGAGLFVAVGQGGVMTSPDGITWTSRTASYDTPWSSVTYGAGLFVAVATSGSGNRVMTSPDGITWTSRTASYAASWTSVTYGAGLFVAVANIGGGNVSPGPQVMTSPDGITWTSRTAAARNLWISVVYANGLFVAVAGTGTINNQVMTSLDGINWFPRTAAATNQWFSVTYANGIFVAVANSGSGNRVMTSGTFTPSPCSLTVTASPSSQTITQGQSATLTASGATSYTWSTGATTASISTTAAGTYSVTGTTGACSATASAVVSVTAAATGPDLSPTLSLPDANFPNTAGASKNFIMSVAEVGGLPTAAGSITVTVSAPAGYTLSFDASLTAINVSGGENNPVAVSNTQWNLNSNVAGQQLSLTIKPGQFIAANGQLNLGITIVRTSANSGSTANITVNISDDVSKTYDGKTVNNVYARVIGGL